MMSKEKNAVWGSLIADSYTLGAHWIYDEKELKNLSIDWETLNAPCAMWHKGKKAGALTHYGDHTLWLLEYIVQNREFDIEGYALYWQKMMQDYKGYIDGSSRETLAALESGKSPLQGSRSHDLSICGRIAPLLLVCRGLDEYRQKVAELVRMTHNDPLVLEAADFFASLLFRVVGGASIQESMIALSENYSDTIKEWIITGKDSSERESFQAIRDFGPACGVEGGFAATIHLLSKYSDYKKMMQANAQAGGDSAARGMAAGMILGATLETFPWMEQVQCRFQVADLLSKI